MKHISFDSIEKAINKVDNLDDDALELLAETYTLAQPVLLGYIMSAATDYENDRLEGLLLYYFCLISEAFAQEGVLAEQVTEEQIAAFEEEYAEILDQYFEDYDDEMLEDFCDQPELVRFVHVEVSEEDEDGTSLDDETATQLFIVLIALVTMMNRALKA